MPRASLLALVGVVFLLAVITVDAVFEDQAGLTDWYAEHIGAVKQVVFQAGQRRGSALVATHAGVLASVKLKSGAIGWRQVLPEGETIDLLVNDKGTLLSLSNGGSLVRAWTSSEGALLWDSRSFAADRSVAHRSHDLLPLPSVPAAAPSPLAADGVLSYRDFDAVFFGKDGDEQVAVLASNQVMVWNAATGEQIWTYKHESPKKLLRLIIASNKLYTIASSDSGLSVIALSPLGVVESEREFPLAGGGSRALSSSSFALLPSGHVVVLTVDGSSVALLDVATSSAVKTVSLAVAGTVTAIGELRTASLFAVATRSHRYVFEITRDLEAKPRHSIEVKAGERHLLSGAVGADGHALIAHSCSTSGGTASGSGDRLSVRVLRSDGGSSTPEHVVASQLEYSNHGGLATAALGVIAAAGGDAVSYAVLAGGRDQSFALVQNDKLAWLREEALAHIRQVEFVDLPIDSSFHQKSFPSLSERIGPQIQLAINSIKQSIAAVRLLVESRSLSSPSPSHVLTKDAFGLKKVIVALTEAGPIVGLDSETGATEWQLLLPELLAADAQAPYRPWRLFQTIASRKCVVVSQSATGAIVHAFDPLSGRAVGTPIVLSSPIVDVQQLPVQTADDESVLLLLGADESVTLLPDSSDARAAFDKHRAAMHFHLTSLEAGTVTGYVVNKLNNGYRAQTTWTVAFPPEIEQIAAVAPRQAHEIVHSAVRMVPGEQAILYKYLNPHLLALATVRSSTGARPVVKKTTDPSVTLYLIDTVSGSILSKIVHRYAAGPVHIVQSENVIVYHYWNTNSNQYEMTVLELYDDRDTSKDGDDTFSSRAAAPPQIQQQTYVFRTGVKALAVSKTMRGITSKDFLLGLSSDQLMSIPKHFLDPLRPVDVEPTPQQREEGLIPYFPDLPFDPFAIISYNRTIANLRGIATTHALLESTSFVFAYGIDLFSARVTPSQTFDLLNEDFNYPFLLATVSLVAVGIVFAHRAASQKALREAWK